MRRRLPGHTPGHTGYLLRGDGDSGDLLLWGDALHLGRIQPADPQIGLVYDLDPQTAARTRRATLERAVQQDWTVASGHVRGFGRVHSAQTGYQIVAA
jgi:glyoxylase-like metal-dependent hydrolase (beta-lactamase superfamily II)